jgi:Flp pilus assembly protein TadD
VNVGKNLVKNRIYYFYSPLHIGALIFLLLVNWSCTSAAVRGSSVNCDSEHAKIAPAFTGRSLSIEQRESLIARLSGLIDDCPEHAGLKILMADAQVSIGNNVFALAYATEALEIEPRNADAMHVKGSILFMEGQTDAAIVLLKKSIELEPNNIEYQTNMCSTWETLGKYNNAVETCSSAIRLAKDSPPPVLYYLRGRAYEALGDVKNSDSDYRKAKALGFDMWPNQ